MKLSDIANVVDIEHDNGQLIEIGITMVNIPDRKILQSYCLPIKPKFELSPQITQLTGWTTTKLNKQGIQLTEAARRLLELYGFTNRLLVSDSSDEIPFIEKCLDAKFSSHRLNVSILFSIFTGKDINLGLQAMLAEFEMQFEGKQHSGIDDSRNIARLFLRLLTMIGITAPEC